jgi:shikimate dehydrogenase
MELRLNKDTVLCISLSGRPGNFGTRFQNFLYQKLDLNFVYKAFTTKDLQGAITGIRALGIRGSAISMPFKEKCISYLDELDASAQGIMSVNTIVNTDGHLKGYNTDYFAVFQLLKSRKVALSLEFVVLGSGGMAKAVVCALRDAGFQRGQIISRNQLTGQALAKQYGYTWSSDIGKERRPGLIINVTPIGMKGTKEAHDLPFSSEIIRGAEVVFDVVAEPSETPLIGLAKSLNKTVITGAEVIVLQAVEQFVLYTGVRPSPELIEASAAFART